MALALRRCAFLARSVIRSTKSFSSAADAFKSKICSSRTGSTAFKQAANPWGMHHGILYPTIYKSFTTLNLAKNYTKTPKVERDVQGPETAKPVWVPSVYESPWSNEDIFAYWVRRMLFPALAVMTIIMGWKYPESLILNLVVLGWCSKPNPSSIHLWLEQRRVLVAAQKYGLDRLKEQVKLPALMHVEVEDHVVFCLARVSSLTETMVVLGFLGNWWVIRTTSKSFGFSGYYT